MKQLLTFSLLSLLTLFSCKKEAQQRTITAITTNISSHTSYTIVVNNTTTGQTPLTIGTNQGISNSTYSFPANSGDVLNVQYAFYTQQQVYGQGNLDITCNGQNLLHANGGNGTNFVINVP